MLSSRMRRIFFSVVSSVRNASHAHNQSLSEKQEGPTDPMFYPRINLGFSITMIIIATIGLASNSLSIHIYTHRTMRSSINTLLLGLAAMDFIVCLLGGLVFTTPGIYIYRGAVGRHTGAILTVITYLTVFVYPIAMIAQTTTVWSLIVITTERFIAIVFPFIAKQWLTVSRARKAIVSTVVISFLYNLIRFFEFRLIHTETDDDQLGNTSIVFYEEVVRTEQWYKQVYNHWMYLFMVFIVPFFALVILNGYIIWIIRIARKNRVSLTHKQCSEHKMSVMTASVIVIFLVTNTPPLVLNVLEIVVPADQLASYNWFYILIDICNTLVITNSSCNFIIYLLFSNRYRLLTTELFQKMLLQHSKWAEKKYFTFKQLPATGYRLKSWISSNKLLPAPAAAANKRNFVGGNSNDNNVKNKSSNAKTIYCATSVV